MELFNEYLHIFEQNIALAVKAKALGRPQKVPTKPNALQDAPFGTAMGAVIESDAPFYIDYYGYLKPTEAQAALVRAVMQQPAPPTHVTATVVHFASLHIEDIATHASGMISKFVPFKQHIVKLRGFTR